MHAFALHFASLPMVRITHETCGSFLRLQCRAGRVYNSEAHSSARTSIDSLRKTLEHLK